VIAKKFAPISLQINPEAHRASRFSVGKSGMQTSCWNARSRSHEAADICGQINHRASP